MAEGAYRAGNVLLQVLLARALVPERYGTFSGAYSLFLVLVALLSLGITEAFIREGALRRERVGSVLAEFFSLRAVSAAATAAAIAAIAVSGGADAPVLFGVGLFLLARSVTAFLATVFRAREEIWKEFAVRAGETAVLLAIAGIALPASWSLATLVGALAAAAAAVAAAAYAGLRVRLSGFGWRFPRGAARRIAAAAPYGLPAVAGSWLLRIDIVAWQRLGGNAARTAFFAAAANVVLGAALAAAVACAALYPSLSRRRGMMGRGEYLRAAGLFLLLGGVLAAALAAAPGPIVRAAYGARYALATPWLAALAPFVVFLAPGIFAMTTLAARGRTIAIAILGLAPLAAKIVLDAVFVRRAPGWIAPSSILLEAVASGAAVLTGLSGTRAHYS